MKAGQWDQAREGIRRQCVPVARGHGRSTVQLETLLLLPNWPDWDRS